LLACPSFPDFIFAGRDDGEDGAAPSKKHAEDGKPVEEDDADNEGEPNKILFVQNLPESAPPAAITAALKQVLTQQMSLACCHIYSSQLFARFNGLSDVRLPPGRPGLAFVEYQTEEFSAAALSALNGFEFDAGRRLKVSFAAK
jgi:U2 small nuclear ribonucleoprotein B''